MTKSNNKILISGTSSGLGKYLYKKIPSTIYNRNKKISYYKKIKWDLIIHCGFYSRNDNIQKTMDSVYHSYCLSNLESKKYIFLSSAIVYEQSKRKTESTTLSLSSKLSNYAKAKIISESFFQKKKTLIIRLGSIIGENMRKNSTYKILFNKNEKINLSKNSLNSFISYSEILEFIKISQKHNLSGIYNFLRTDYIKLSAIEKISSSNITFGRIYFECIKANNKKIQKFINLKKLSSLDILKKFFKFKKK